MSRARLVVAALGLLVAPMALAVDQASYRPVDLAAFLDDVRREHPEMLQRMEGRETGFLHPFDKLRATAWATGRIRPLSGFKARTVVGWARQNFPGLPEGQLRREIEVEVADRRLWIAIQEILVPYWETEVKAGGRVEVFVVFFGATHEEYLLILNEFLAAAPKGG